ncbi:hypothetical protein B0H14DRAFT_3116658 [Mycena olivaceomarginata]|nr:hypothetical protein B0H14DRAFT_3116658 [Mycena olivaceomarginata]
MKRNLDYLWIGFCNLVSMPSARSLRAFLQFLLPIPRSLLKWSSLLPSPFPLIWSSGVTGFNTVGNPFLRPVSTGPFDLRRTPIPAAPEESPMLDIENQVDTSPHIEHGSYFKIIPHPHSTDPVTRIIPLGSSEAKSSNTAGVPLTRNTFGRSPWFPFRTRADFEVSEIVVKGALNTELTNKLLNGVKHEWGTGKSRHTLSLHGLRLITFQFKSGSVLASYKGEEQEIRFQYRDPWQWITTLLDDETLASTSIYNSVRKYYCEGSVTEVHEERVIDEPNTAKAWERFESELPEPDPYPHCLLPLHFWLDEGLVTKRITMHPMVLRPVFQPGNIRNASGNGGGVLVGYMNMATNILQVRDDSDPSNRNTAETLEFAKFKMEVYQKVLAVIFSSLKSRSWNREAIRCPDGLSLDGKEAAYFNACRAALANLPCPKCLVQKPDLHKITSNFELRTTPTMKAVVIRAMKATTKTKKESILKNYGLHGVQHFLWNFRFSDPYAAYSYDTLHSDDLGKWGHHLWKLLLDELENLKQKGPFAERMRNFPRWPNLKHFNAVTTIHFTDGQSFYDILKCVLPCIVQLFPPDNVLVHCIRAFQRYRLMVGMYCMPERRLKRLDTMIEDYEYWSSGVADVYGKNFDFFKQHAVSHVVSGIWDKGTTNHGSTRPGEGFQQEAREAYKQTNCKDVAPQMSRIDEIQEAIARIRMTIDNDDRAQRGDPDDEVDETLVDPQSTEHWAFGAPVPGRLLNSGTVEEAHRGSPAFKILICVRGFKCAHISYQSLEDWRGARDIIRCNPCFHQQPRYDSLLVNFSDPGLHFARTHALLRCNLPSGRKIDVAIVRMFKPTRWKPRTFWSGCQIREESKKYSFLSMGHVIRGALMAPAVLHPAAREMYPQRFKMAPHNHRTHKWMGERDFSNNFVQSVIGDISELPASSLELRLPQNIGGVYCGQPPSHKQCPRSCYRDHAGNEPVPNPRCIAVGPAFPCAMWVSRYEVKEADSR